MANRDDQRMYRFDLLDRTGVFLGFGLVQLGLLGGGGLGSTLALTIGVPLPVAVAPAIVGVVVAVGRVRGERLVDWLPIAVRWLLGRRRRQWLAPLHLLGADDADQPALPPFLTGMQLLEAPDDWGRLAGAGVVHDTSAGAMSALVRVRGQDFALAPRTSRYSCSPAGATCSPASPPNAARSPGCRGPTSRPRPACAITSAG
jgi:hypothetical protein